MQLVYKIMGEILFSWNVSTHKRIICLIQRDDVAFYQNTGDTTTGLLSCLGNNFEKDILQPPSVHAVI